MTKNKKPLKANYKNATPKQVAKAILKYHPKRRQP